MTDKGVGARLARKEDRRFLLGQGEYVANLRLAGMLDVAFVRSPMAHARIKGVLKPKGFEDCVFVCADLDGVPEAYAAMDERRAIKSLLHVSTL